MVIRELKTGTLAAYLNRQLLVSYWPVLRMLVGRIIRDAWESAFPELNEGQPTGA